jgi:LEA14-like dessication related protein
MTKSIPAIPLAVISLVLLGTLATGAPAAAAPRVEVPETTFDFGKVYEDKELVHTFTINNTGDAPLRIKGIDPDCDCTAADYDRQIPPGGRGKITLTIVSYSVLKMFAKHTKVFLNDPERPEITLTMQGWGLPMIDIEPHHIVRFQGKIGGEFKARVRFVSHLSSPLEIKQVTTNIPQYIEVSLTPEVAGKIYVLEVKNQRQEPGHYAGKIELTTNDRKKPRLMVRVFADLAPAPAAKP